MNFIFLKNYFILIIIIIIRSIKIDFEQIASITFYYSHFY